MRTARAERHVLRREVRAASDASRVLRLQAPILGLSILDLLIPADESVSALVIS
jgi:hypothetical protein